MTVPLNVGDIRRITIGLQIPVTLCVTHIEVELGDSVEHCL